MSVHPKTTPAGAKRYVVRWREGDRNRSQAFTRRKDADAYDAEVNRRKQLGPIAVQMLDAGGETLDDYVANSWAVGHTAHLAKPTRALYASLYDKHIGPFLGSVPLRELTSDRIAAWQTQRLAAGAGPEAVRKSHTLLGNVLQRAVESRRIASNPQRLVRKAKAPRREEVRPLAPVTVEAMLAAIRDGVPRSTPAKRHAPKGEHVAISKSPERDATLVAVLAYAGLRPGEALGLTWGHVLDRTLTVNATKTNERRSVRLLAPLASDLASWKLQSEHTAAGDFLFPSPTGGRWRKEQYDSWRSRVFAKAADAVDRPDATPYTARHSFASLLLHEGRSVIYVARQLGHDANLTLSTYGHVIEELDGAPQKDAEAVIRAARGTDVPSQFPRVVSGV
ncbi:MAG: site-specific integrase [Solirubrobacterales bacterium]|nr:site-specific integrase [Solirubrobacterales bacterium]